MVKVLNPGKNVSYATILSESSDNSINSVEHDLIKELYKEFGAILFKGFNLTVETFRLITTAFCTHSVINLSPGRETIDKANNIQTVDPGIAPFPLHPEMSRLPWKPDVCFFGCLRAPKEGGETIICDGVKLVRLLPTRILKQVNRKHLKYSHEASDDEVKYWLNSNQISDEVSTQSPEDCPFEFSKYQNKTIRSYIVPFLHKPMFVNRLAFGNYLLFARYIHQNIWFPVYQDGSIVPTEIVQAINKAGERSKEIIRWEPNDLVMIDNTRFLHGRNKIQNTEERRIITYFGFLNFARKDRDPVPNARWRDPNWQIDF